MGLTYLNSYRSWHYGHENNTVQQLIIRRCRGKMGRIDFCRSGQRVGHPGPTRHGGASRTALPSGLEESFSPRGGSGIQELAQHRQVVGGFCIKMPMQIVMSTSGAFFPR
jgi:hypothetical protein